MARFQYAGVIQDSAGNAQSGVPVTVSVHGGGTAAIYPTEVGGSPLAALVSDLTGSFVFWADNSFTYEIAPAGFSPRVVPGSTPGSVGPAGTSGGSYINPAVSPYSIDKTGTTDVTSGLNTALASGSVLLPDGLYQINGIVTVPYDKDFLGTGSARVTLRLGVGGQIAHGNRLTNGIGQGGTSGGFYVDGVGVANVAGGGLYIGLCLSRTFRDIRTHRCAGDGCVIESAQNCYFQACQFGPAGGSALVWDYGISGNTFKKCEINGGVRYALEIRQTAAGPAGTNPNGPSFNAIRDTIIEYVGGATLASTLTGTYGYGLGMVYQGAGSDNLFDNVTIAGARQTTGSHVIIERALAAVGEVNLTLNNCQMLGDATYTTAIDQRGSASRSRVNLTGKNIIAGFLRAHSMKPGSGDVCYLYGPAVEYVAVTTPYFCNDGSSTPFTAAVFQPRRHPVQHFAAAAGDPVETVIGPTGQIALLRAANNTAYLGDATNPLTFQVYVGYYNDGAIEWYQTNNLHVNGALGHAGTKVGLNGAAPVTKGTITGSRSGNAALANLLTYLASRGDITDSTT